MKSTLYLLVVTLLALVGCATSTGSGERVTAIVGATVIDVEHDLPDAVQPNMTVVITGDRISAVGPAATTQVPLGADVIEGKGRWIVPGLIDSHVHFFQSGNLFTRPDVIDLTKIVPYADEVARNKARIQSTFKVWLASGVTSVLDLGGPLWNFEVRAIAQGTEAAPRVSVAGPLLSLIDDPALDLGDPPIIKIRTPDEARMLAEQQIKLEADYIKVWFIHDSKEDLKSQTDIVRTVSTAAHKARVPFAVHATELDVAKAALRSGADYLVHSVEDRIVDEEFIALMKQNSAIYCPTLFVVMGYDFALSDQWTATDSERRLADVQVLSSMRGLASVPRDQLPKWVAKAIDERATPALSPVMAENLRRVWAAGLTVAMGTDAGNIGTVHGPSVFREMELMHEAGLTTIQVLRTATLNGAKVLHRQDSLGTVSPGKLADLLILDADPLLDLSNLSHAFRVIKGGQVFQPEKLISANR